MLSPQMVNNPDLATGVKVGVPKMLYSGQTGEKQRWPKGVGGWEMGHLVGE